MKTRRRLKIRVVFGIIFFLSTLYFLVTYILNLPIKSVYISGNSFITISEIKKNSQITEDTLFLSYSKEKIKENISKHDYIKEVVVKKNIDRTVKITVTERKPLFYYEKKKILVLEDYILVSDENFFNGVPSIINEVTEDILKKFANKLTNINYDLILKISTITYAPSVSEGIIIDDERFIFVMNDGNEVHVNIGNLEKFNNYDEFKKVINEKGTLYLDNSSPGNIFKYE